MADKTVIITGGAGFIGSHLCNFFIKKDFNVIAIDNFITGNIKNIEHLIKNKKFKLLKADVSKFIKVDYNVDFVLHFASPASPIDYLKYPIQTLKVGALGTHNALGLAKVKKAVFMLASTSEVYGDPLIHPQTENYWGNVNPIGPRGVYDEAKRYAEAITMAYHKTHEIPIRIARIFNTYGPRMRLGDGRVVPNFISQALKDEPITIYGDGNHTRSFCYIRDMVSGLYKLLLSDINQPVNIGNPAEITIIEFAKLVIKLLNSKSEITYLPLPEDDPKMRRPDISFAKGSLKWEPEVDIETGILKSIKWFKEKIE